MSELKTVNIASYKTTIQVGAGKLKQVSWYFINVLFFKNSFIISPSLKVFLLRLFGASVGKGVNIKPCVNIKYPWKLQIGNYSWLGEELWIDNLSDVIIGNNVILSQGALILTGSHDPSKASFDFTSLPVILQDGCWIGARAVVYGGVTCHSHCILGINAVAESDLQAYTIYKGNPAVPVLKRVIY
ncbi:MAG: WcaF family extracellular polysaccharide biosynthesis acetyltransferase [Ferruginibacter sp.]